MTNYAPRPLHYYFPELEINGTSEELFIEARNGYIENVDTLNKIQEILANEKETEKAMKVGFIRDALAEQDKPYSVSQMKLDFLDGYAKGCDDIAIDNDGNILLTVLKEDGVVVAITDYRKDELSENAIRISFDDFLAYSTADFDEIVNSLVYYSY